MFLQRAEEEEEEESASGNDSHLSNASTLPIDFPSSLNPPPIPSYMSLFCHPIPHTKHTHTHTQDRWLLLLLFVLAFAYHSDRIKSVVYKDLSDGYYLLMAGLWKRCCIQVMEAHQRLNRCDSPAHTHTHTHTPREREREREREKKKERESYSRENVLCCALCVLNV